MKRKCNRNKARTHIEIKDTYSWQNLTIKHINSEK